MAPHFRTKLYDKRDDFNIPIVNFPFICSSIPTAPAYGVYISQLIRYFRACGSYQDFLDRGLLLTRKLLNQWFLFVKLKLSFRKVYGSVGFTYRLDRLKPRDSKFRWTRYIIYSTLSLDIHTWYVVIAYCTFLTTLQ
jgi:hypothetical protein